MTFFEFSLHTKFENSCLVALLSSFSVLFEIKQSWESQLDHAGNCLIYVANSVYQLQVLMYQLVTVYLLVSHRAFLTNVSLFQLSITAEDVMSCE